MGDSFMDELTPYQLSQIRDALSQAGSDQGAMLAGGLRLGGVEMQSGAGELSITGKVRRSEAISAGITRSTAQSINDITWTAISFDTTVWDTDSIYDFATYPTRLTVRTGGIYIITGFGQWASNGTGQRWMRIYLNGTNEIAKVSTIMTGTAYTHAHSVSIVYSLIQGDYVELSVYQNSGGALNMNSSSPTYLPTFSLARLV
jgi:hypothetical protein